MELKDFISETIKHIIDGTNEAIDYGKKNDASVNPSGELQFGDGSPFALRKFFIQGTDEIDYEYAQVIDFDVAVSTSQTGEVSSEVGIFVVPLFGRVKATGDKSSSAVSRIQFSIPVILSKRHLG